MQKFPLKTSKKAKSSPQISNSKTSPNSKKNSKNSHSKKSNLPNKSKPSSTNKHKNWKDTSSPQRNNIWANQTLNKKFGPNICFSLGSKNIKADKKISILKSRPSSRSTTTKKTLKGLYLNLPSENTALVNQIKSWNTLKV